MKTLKKSKFFPFFIFLLFIPAVGGFFIVNVISKQKSDTLTINLAGRKRILVQKFSKELPDNLNNRQIIAAVTYYIITY